MTLRESKQNEQGSEEWEAMRKSLFITGSDAPKMMGTTYEVFKPKSKLTPRDATKQWWRVKRGFDKEKKAPQIFLDHGTRHEPDARSRFLEVYPEYKNVMIDVGCVTLGEIHGFSPEDDRWENYAMGGSPDGIVYDPIKKTLSLVEFKCPYNRKWDQYANTGIPDYYLDQIYFYMLLTGINHAYYAEYYCSKNHIIKHRNPKMRVCELKADLTRLEKIYNTSIEFIKLYADSCPEGAEMRDKAIQRMKKQHENKDSLKKNKN